MLRLDDAERADLWRQVIDAVEGYATGVEDHPVAPSELDPAALRRSLRRFDFDKGLPPRDAVAFAVDGLWTHQVHTPHPRYFGLFNPAPTTMGIAADTLVAAFNPQLAAWSHSPFAAEIERHVVAALAARFGLPPDTADGVFTSGGMEANHTAVLTALTRAFPSYGAEGARGAPGAPTLYVSADAHHSMIKAARLCGLGTDAARVVPLDRNLALDVGALQTMLSADRAAGCAPFLIVATAGTTSAGVVDPLAPLADVAERHQLWLHVDAAWGGACALVPELRGQLAGIERADSITFDAHKWLSVPMAAGLYLTRHEGILDRTFRVEQSYMPREADGLDVVDPWAHSIQWSRRFIGLKVFLSLAVAGWDGYAEAIRQQWRMGVELRARLEGDGWEVVNQTELPLCCFVDATRSDGRQAEYLDAVGAAVVGDGGAWISVPRLGGDRPALRACITNYRTGPEDLDALLAALSRARATVPVAPRSGLG